ncbi:hypothetical protein OSB04_007089 [Centaurea solstitialis]|uniref:Uncharacterized protein n=1 Tax=Centaurea solstitialis TaxID=347529 RepID=A0AA38TJ91_9ASTR|nr:hypothetical protein OSB04_007089 [Centaurea solstitialis]
MVSHSWTTNNHMTNRVLSFDMILSDEQHCSIHAKIPAKLIDTIKSQMMKGCVYRIHRFSILPYNTLYRRLHYDHFVEFLHETRIYASHIQPTAFDRHAFDLIPFGMLYSRVLNDKYLTDVIGVVREWGLLENQVGKVQSCNPEMRKVIISDISGVKLRLTLWGKLAKKYSNEYIRSYKDDKIIVILTSCKVRVFKGVPCLMTTIASQLYFNLPLDIVALYKDIEATPVSFQSEKMAIFTSQIFIVVYNKGTSYTIDVVIIGIDMFNDWKFVQCRTCLKKAMYKLYLRVTNSQEEMLCVLCNEAAIDLVDLTVDELLMKSNLEIDRFNLPPQYVRRFIVTKYHGDDINMPNKASNTTESGSSSILPQHGHDNCDVEEEDQTWLNNITNDECEMSAKSLWGPCIVDAPTTTSTSPSVVRCNHKVDDSGDSGNSKSEENGFEGEEVCEKVLTISPFGKKSERRRILQSWFPLRELQVLVPFADRSRTELHRSFHSSQHQSFFKLHLDQIQGLLQLSLPLSPLVHWHVLLHQTTLHPVVNIQQSAVTEARQLTEAHESPLVLPEGDVHNTMLWEFRWEVGQVGTEKIYLLLLALDRHLIVCEMREVDRVAYISLEDFQTVSEVAWFQNRALKVSDQSEKIIEIYVVQIGFSEHEVSEFSVRLAWVVHTDMELKE